MSRIALVHVDGKLPNLALMKIATYHKQKGDSVEWWNPLESWQFDKVYVSKIFKFSEMKDSYGNILPIDEDNFIVGGTGTDPDSAKAHQISKLDKEIDDCDPGLSWDLYKNFDNHLGFSSKGCRFDCPFCVVPEKEGQPRATESIDQILSNPRGEDRLVLLDDDFLAPKLWRNTLEQIVDKKLRVCFSQGLNIRVITKPMAEMLKKTKYRSNSFKSNLVTFAWDNYHHKDLIMKGIDICLTAGMSPSTMQFFVLVGYNGPDVGYRSTIEQDMERVMTLHEFGCKPYVMLYDRKNEERKKFQQWVNNRPAFNSCKYEDYDAKEMQKIANKRKKEKLSQEEKDLQANAVNINRFGAEEHLCSGVGYDWD